MGEIALAIRKTSSVKGEENPWQALADAIIIQAVKDYRNRARMIRRIRGRLKKPKKMTSSESTFQAQRLPCLLQLSQIWHKGGYRKLFIISKGIQKLSCYKALR